VSNVDNAARFAARLKDFSVNTYPGIAASVSAEFAMEAVRRIVRRMPVRTGHARGNVQVSFFGAASIELPLVDPVGASTIAAAERALANAKATQNIHISVTVPYGMRLEQGWSRQAPQGMVRITLAELQAEARAIGARGAQKAIAGVGIRAPRGAA